MFTEEDNTERIMDSVEDLYPAIPSMFVKCRVVISEIGVKTENAPSFVELQRICPPTARTRARTLTGYYILVVRIGDPSTIYMSFNLDKKIMRQVEDPASSIKKKTSQFYVIGSDELNADSRFSAIVNMITPADGIKGIPGEDESTFAVVLLHIPDKHTISVVEPTLLLSNGNIEATVGMFGELI